jgi:hypothetical protein
MAAYTAHEPVYNAVVTSAHTNAFLDGVRLSQKAQQHANYSSQGLNYGHGHRLLSVTTCMPKKVLSTEYINISMLTNHSTSSKTRRLQHNERIFFRKESMLQVILYTWQTRMHVTAVLSCLNDLIIAPARFQAKEQSIRGPRFFRYDEGL